jgi:gamma-glutamyltranspeptidase/glutathione hydrolase
MQPQGHVQVLMRCIDFNQNPQEALDAFRWQWISGRKVQIEPGFPLEAARQLSEIGHQIEIQPDSSATGRGQIIWRDELGVLCGATEPRTDGCVAAY